MIYFERRARDGCVCVCGGGAGSAEWIQWTVAFAAGVSLLTLMTNDNDLLCCLDEYIIRPAEQVIQSFLNYNTKL